MFPSLSVIQQQNNIVARSRRSQISIETLPSNAESLPKELPALGTYKSSNLTTENIEVKTPTHGRRRSSVPNITIIAQKETEDSPTSPAKADSHIVMEDKEEEALCSDSSDNLPHVRGNKEPKTALIRHNRLHLFGESKAEPHSAAPPRKIYFKDDELSSSGSSRDWSLTPSEFEVRSDEIEGVMQPKDEI